MKASRERKEDMLAAMLDSARLGGLLVSMVGRHGMGWLTDEQLDDLVRECIARERSRSRINRQNRRTAA